MEPIALVLNSSMVPPGRLLDALDDAGAESLQVDLPAGDALPPDDEVGAYVLLGGEMGAYEEADHSFLSTEKQLIRDAMETDTPILGICLGAQLIADALGGKAYLADRPEVGLISLDYTDAGARHPVLSHSAPRVFAMHQDTFVLPTGATLLASSERFPHAFEIGAALAVQFHPEADAAQGIAWARRPESTILSRAGVTAEDLGADLQATDAERRTHARDLFGAWLASLSR